MKRILSVGLLTVCALAFSEHQADAWVNSKFSIGLNFHQQSANTSYLWGFWRNGQIPGPEAFGPGGGGVGIMPSYGPGVGPAGPFPFMGGHPLMSQQMPPQAAPQQGAFNQGAFQQNAYMQNMQRGYPVGYPQAAFQPMGYPQAAFQPSYPQTLPPSFFVDSPAPTLPNTAQMPYMPTMRTTPFQAVNYQGNGNGYYYYPVYSYDVPYYWYGSR
jgi:hypothetical protein